MKRIEEKIKILDYKIDECIKKLENAKSGIEFKASIIEYEQLRFTRDKLFTNYLMMKKSEKNARGQRARNTREKLLMIAEFVLSISTFIAVITMSLM